jgi:hypothetical protein
VAWVVVPEAGDGGAAELGAVHDARVVELVQQDRVARTDQGADGADVGGVAGAEHQRALPAGEPGHLGLELLVQRDGAGERADAGGAGAVLVDRGLRGGGDPLVAAEADVAVAGHHQQALAVDLDVGAVAFRAVGDEVVAATGFPLELVDSPVDRHNLRLEVLPGS